MYKMYNFYYIFLVIETNNKDLGDLSKEVRYHEGNSGVLLLIHTVLNQTHSETSYRNFIFFVNNLNMHIACIEIRNM